VQGRLREEATSVTIETSCAHCDEPIQIAMDSELSYRVLEEGADPFVYVPMVDTDEVEEPSIIDAF
jgi:hypothetical protein